MRFISDYTALTIEFFQSRRMIRWHGAFVTLYLCTVSYRYSSRISLSFSLMSLLSYLSSFFLVPLVLPFCSRIALYFIIQYVRHVRETTLLRIRTKVQLRLRSDMCVRACVKRLRVSSSCSNAASCKRVLLNGKSVRSTKTRVFLRVVLLLYHPFSLSFILPV